MVLSLLVYKESPSAHPILFLFLSLFVCLFFIAPMVAAGHTTPSDISGYRFDFIGMDHTVQVKGTPIKISAVINPSTDIASVHLVLTKPDRSVTSIPLQYETEGKYTLRLRPQLLGKHYFYLSLQTDEQGLFQSMVCSFWISTSLSDKDNDGISDEWEAHFGFDSENASDAAIDVDGDGYSTFREFQMQTNPLENNVIENAWFQICEKQMYLGISLLLCLVLCFFSWYGMRRMMV